MAAHDRDRPDNLSRAVDLIREGETVLALIDPAARGRDRRRSTHGSRRG